MDGSFPKRSRLISRNTLMSRIQSSVPPVSWRPLSPQLPIELSEHAILAGTQRDAFAASYALINPAFRVETFRGYCDPLEVYQYVTPTEDITEERIAAMRSRAAKGPYVRMLNEVYDQYKEYTEEVAFFVEQVTGHMIPDFRPALKSVSRP